MNNIVLIGMPSSGKSVCGVVVAKALKMKYVDTDLAIQESTGKALQEIIEREGVDAFKVRERKILCSIEANNAVIATGGSAVYYPEAMSHLKKDSIVVYLDASLETIEKRLKNIKSRGVAMAKDQTLRELYHMRKPLYEKYADVCVKTGNEPLETTVTNIINLLKGEITC